MGRQVKVLIVDDSRIFRSVVEEALKGVNDIEVIGSARNGVKALEFIKSTRPDLVTLDVEMPEMDGLDTLSAIQEINKSTVGLQEIGVIMLSALTHVGASTTIEALEVGAFDFVAKPDSGDTKKNLEVLRSHLVSKIHAFAVRRENGVKNGRQSTASTTQVPAPVVNVATTSQRKETSSIRAILIGVSTGGPKALSNMLPELTSKTNDPIFIVQHMPPKFTESLAKSLDKKCEHTVIEAKNNDLVQSNYVYIAPGGRHLVLRKGAGGEVFTYVTDQPPENGCRPSVDILFRSAATVYGGDAIAIVLTGMGSDGAKGLAPLVRNGVHVIVQDEKTSVVWGMPGSAVAAGCVDDVLPLLDIPKAAESVIKRKKG